MIFICLKYFCIDLSGLSRLDCPCLRLTDDDDDSRPAQMIPIALMIPARVWSAFDNIFLFLFTAGEGQKEILPHARAYQLWLSRFAFRSFYFSLSLWSVNLTPVFAEQKSVASGRREGGEANHTIRPGSSYDGISIVVLGPFYCFAAHSSPQASTDIIVLNWLWDCGSGRSQKKLSWRLMFVSSRGYEALSPGLWPR